VYLRYMAATDGSPASSVAWEYLCLFMRIHPRIRVASVSAGGMRGRWEMAMPLLSTPMVGPFVNVVCCDPSRWTWVQTCSMPNPDGSSSDAVARMGLYTVGVKNVLIVHTAQVSPEQRQAALAYEAIVAPSEEVASAWLPACTHVITPTDGDRALAALRSITLAEAA
jgi:hypothetical protein